MARNKVEVHAKRCAKCKSKRRPLFKYCDHCNRALCKSCFESQRHIDSVKKMLAVETQMPDQLRAVAGVTTS